MRQYLVPLLLALIVMYFGLRWFNLSVGGLFSSEQQLAPWSWAKVADLLWHLPIPMVILSLAGTAQLVRIMRAVPYSQTLASVHLVSKTPESRE